MFHLTGDEDGDCDKQGDEGDDKKSGNDIVDTATATSTTMDGDIDIALCVSLLLRAGSDPFVRNQSGETALYLCAMRGGAAAVETILRHLRAPSSSSLSSTGGSGHHSGGAGVSFVTTLGGEGRAEGSKSSSAHHRYQGKEEEGTKEDFCPIDAFARDAQSFTPLHAAVLRGCLRTSSLLLRAGCSPNYRNCYGQTPLHFAHRVGMPELILLLQEHGGREDVPDDVGCLPAGYQSNKKSKARGGGCKNRQRNKTKMGQKEK